MKAKKLNNQLLGKLLYKLRSYSNCKFEYSIEISKVLYFSCFIALCRYCAFFNELRVCGRPVLSKSVGTIFPSVCSLQVPVTHGSSSISDSPPAERLQLTAGSDHS